MSTKGCSGCPFGHRTAGRVRLTLARDSCCSRSLHCRTLGKLERQPHALQQPHAHVRGNQMAGCMHACMHACMQPMPHPGPLACECNSHQQRLLHSPTGMPLLVVNTCKAPPAGRCLLYRGAHPSHHPPHSWGIPASHNTVPTTCCKHHNTHTMLLMMHHWQIPTPVSTSFSRPRAQHPGQPHRHTPGGLLTHSAVSKALHQAGAYFELQNTAESWRPEEEGLQAQLCACVCIDST
jgi:hypothetical protein